MGRCFLRGVTARKKARRRWGAPWTTAEDKQLGKIPDSVLARRTGRTIKEVVAERQRCRIRLPTPARSWTASEIRLLGKFTDREAARRLRRSYGDVRQQRTGLRIPSLRPSRARKWARWEEKLLGKFSDKELAARLKRSRAAVQAHRIGLGLGKYHLTPKQWTIEEEHLLGSATDRPPFLPGVICWALPPLLTWPATPGVRKKTVRSAPTRMKKLLNA